MRLLVLGLFANFFLPLSVRSEILNEIPFQYRDGLIWLTVRVTERDRPLNFLLDSGAGVSAVDLRTARGLGLELINRQIVQGVNGQAFAYQVKHFRAVSGRVTLPESVLAVDLGAVSSRCHQPVDGILGADFFRGQVAQIDFSAGRVRLLENCDLNLANCEILPIKICNDAFCVPVRVANEPARWTRLDTGCDTALEWIAGETERKRMDQTSIGLSHRSVRYIDTCVQIGKQRFTRVKAGVHKEQFFPGEAGLLGNAFLSKFRVTIDEPRNRVILERAR
jgi:hypothetical protein